MAFVNGYNVHTVIHFSNELTALNTTEIFTIMTYLWKPISATYEKKTCFSKS